MSKEQQSVSRRDFLKRSAVVSAGAVPAASMLSACSKMLGDRYGLTAREVDVFVLLAQGRTQTRIEKELTLSKSTVKTHMGSIFLKLGVHSKQEIIDLVFCDPENDEVSSWASDGESASNGITVG